MKGWQCPNCGYCYSPSTSDCSNCNRPEYEKVKTTTPVHGSSDYCGCSVLTPRLTDGRCSVCGKYPATTISSWSGGGL